MKLKPFLYKTVLVVIALFSFQGFSQNLLNNGNFETGTVVGFFSNGAGYVRIFPPFSGTTVPGNWALTTNPQPMNTASFVASGDHTTGVGIMMVIDGNTTGGQQNFWEAGNGGGGVCGLTAGVQYTFSYWIKSIYGSVSGTPTPAVIGVQILNASAVTLVSGSLTAPPTASGWQQVVFTFIANGACANIKLYNNNTSADGNDFAVDDFSVTAPPLPLSLSYISSNPTCPATATGLITAAASNGVPPYTIYNLTGAATQNNTTGVFSGLLAGNYTISVTDTNGTTVSTNVTLVDPPGLTTSADTAICSGSSTTLTVSGGSSVYTWTANPSDPSLTTPNSSSPTVSPTQTTTYTVTSASTGNVNLISNGDFSSGNTGFSSAYTYFNPANITFAQRAYGVVANPNTWEPGFSGACVDHTTGTGLMMVVDGSTTNGGNDMVWGQNIAVTPGQNYTFSYWLQTIASGSPAVIRTVINGVLIGTANASATVCGWTQYTYVWNSGASTLAQIQLFDSNVSAGGNDFALDDISFTTTLTCDLTKNITITVTTSLTPVISCGTSTASSVTFNWPVVTGATGYTISYSINGGPIVNVGSIALTTYTVNGLSSGNSVQIFVTPTGVGCFVAANATCVTTSLSPCPTPTVSVTQQPTCAVPTGTIVFTSPLNPCPLTQPTDLFISEVTDESTGALSYIEIYNGTGTPKNLANYKLKVYNNGNPGPSLNCDFPLSGTLANNDVYVVSVGTVVNQGGVVPDLVVAICPGFNTNDNVRLTTIADVEIDLWGRTDGVDFTPGNQSGYTYRRNVCATHPWLTWNPADWAALDPQDYTNVGSYQMAIYEYSVNGTTYQSSPTFTGLAPNTYNVTIRDLISGCVSTPTALTINPITAVGPPTVSPITYCQNAVAVPLTATPSAGGTLNWYGTNATGGTASGTAPTPLTTGAVGSVVHYYVSQTIGGCESARADIAVTIGNNPPTATPFLFCDGANTTATSVAFDFNNVGQTSFSYSYSIAGGPPVTGSLTAPSHFDVPVSAPGTEVTFTITWNGVCTPSQTKTCYATCTTTPVLNITNPAAVCSPNTVNITLPAVTAGSTGGGTLSYWTNATATTALANPTAISTSGTYYIKSSLGGCSDINPVVVIINPSPTLTITNPAAVCEPTTVNITLPAVTAGSTGGGTLSYWTNAAATTPLANPTALTTSGTYYIKSTVGTCFDIEPVTVTINPTPVLNITYPSAACSPNTIDITLPAVTAGSTGGGTLSYWTNPTATTPLANPTAISTSGTYYIKSTVGTCVDIEPVTLTVNITPVLSITNPTAVCAPNTVDITLPTVTAGSTGGGTLSYWINPAATTTLTNPTAIASSGTYYIKSTVGTCVDIEPVTVTVNPTPVLVITNPTAVCSPGTVDITLASVTAGSLGIGTLSYWTNAGGTTALANPTSIATNGTYYIKSTIGTCSDIRPVVVTINPTPVLIITNPAAVCSPNTVNITLPAVTTGSTGGGTLSYWTNATATTALANPTAVTASGTYYIKITVGTCFDIEPITVTINTTPVLSITNPAAVCSPGTVDITLPAVTVGSTGGGTLSYWTNVAATTALANPTSIATNGTYYIKSTLGSCSDIDPVTITIATTPVLSITNPAAVCSPNTVDITLPAVTVGSTGGGTLSYWTNASATTILANPTAVATNGTYYIKSTLGSCSDIEPVVVTINPTPVLSITNPAAVCSPNTVDITLPAVTAGSTSVGTLSYWTNATATTALANPTAVATSGTYFIKSTLGSCSDIEPVTVTINNPNLIITNPGTVCAPATVDITLPAVTAGSTGGGTLSYWTNAAATTALANPTAVAIGGTYYIKSTVGTCFDIEPVVVTISANFVVNNPLPLQSCDPNNDGFERFDLTQTINSITGGNPAYTISFHETQVDANVGGTSILTPASYDNIIPFLQTIYIRVTSSTSTCYQVVTLQLIINPTPVATEPDDYELCDYTGASGYETFDLTSTVSQILGTINPLTHAVTFYTTQGAAELGTGNITNPTSYTNTTIDTQTIYVRVETTATGCYDIVTLQLIVNPLPNATQPNYPQYSLCDTTGAVGFETFDLASKVSTILLGQTGMDVTFYPSLLDAQVGSNAITNLQYTNAIIYVQTLGIRITNQATGCYVISTIDIRVEPLPVLIPPVQPYTLCDANQDGYTTFDLTTLLSGLLNGVTTYTVSFHETITDAENNGNTIPNPAAYDSILAFTQIIYVRAEDNITHCVSIIPIELNVNPSPIAPVNLDPITVCDQDSNPQDASTPVDLTQTTAAVLAQQTGAATDYTVTYYTSQPLAEQGTAPIINDTSYVVNDGDTIWVRVEHNTTGCYNIGSFQLEINTPLLLTTPIPLNVCDADAIPNDQLYVFDLTIKNNEINQGTGYMVTYYPSLVDAQNNTNVITTPTAYLIQNPPVQTLGAVVTTTEGCKSITTLDIRVLPIPTPRTSPAPLAPKCDDNNPGDMLEVFDLTVNEAYIRNGDPNLTFHYFATQANAIANTGELIPATAALVGTNVWIRVENNMVDYQGENCYVLVEQPLTVNPLPIVVQPLAPYRACDNDTDGIAVFDLTNPDLAEAILGTTQLPADFTISYHLTQAAATAGSPSLPNSYTNATPNAQDIYVRVVNNATGCVNTGVLPLAVEAYATATGPQVYNECDNDGNPYDGVGLIDLTTYAPDILNGQDATIFLVSYYTSLANAVAGTNALTLAQAQAYQTAAGTDTIWVKVENSSNLITPVCYAITTINIRVEPYPNPVINTANNVTTICVDFITNQVVRPLTLNSGVINPGNYTFEWFEDASTTPIPGATGPTYTVDTPAPGGATRAYTVRVTSVTPQACQTTSAAFSVLQSGQAVIAAGTIGYTVTSAFSSAQIITVTVEGYGAPDYQYSLDDGPRQASNVFENVSMGTHIIHVWDAKGDIAYSCEELIITEVKIIDYPHYFTPNGDGIHDTWNIIGLEEQLGAKIFIFDRYGKLLKQISPNGAGWDGTYNGHLLPSDDYWFTVDFAEGGVMKQFKSHFAMKR